MAHKLSAKKRIRQTETKRLNNRYFTVSTRNAIKKLRTTTDKTEATNLYPKVSSMIDKLAKKNIIHSNKASNLKSKLFKYISKLS
jgi:small subunit ribosomal protein S20